MRSLLIAAGASDKVFLTVEGFGAGRYRGIPSIGLEFASLGVVGEVSVQQYISEVAFCFSVGDRSHDFDAVFQISRHPVGAAYIKLFVAAIRKPENTAVFEETADDTMHAYVLRQARNTRTQNTDAANDQIYLYAGA